jgi:hypothetical protein
MGGRGESPPLDIIRRMDPIRHRLVHRIPDRPMAA